MSIRIVLKMLAFSLFASSEGCSAGDYQEAVPSGSGGAIAIAQGSSSSGEGGAAGNCSDECCAPTDCPEPTLVCMERACVSGQCGETQVLAGTSSPWQIKGDCMEFICDAGGHAIEVPAASDPLDDDNQCTHDTCNAGVTVSTTLPAGSACFQHGGSFCNADAECVSCLSDADCPSGPCTAAGVCIPQACVDGMQSPGETDLDCGGPCGATCEVGRSCHLAADCLDGVCKNDVCAPPSCVDLVRNSDETDVDCGGSCSTPCGPLKGCKDHEDCAGGQCTGTVCVPNCQDGVKDNAETGVDCGGPSCPVCGARPPGP